MVHMGFIIKYYDFICIPLRYSINYAIFASSMRPRFACKDFSAKSFLSQALSAIHSLRVSSISPNPRIQVLPTNHTEDRSTTPCPCWRLLARSSRKHAVYGWLRRMPHMRLFACFAQVSKYRSFFPRFPVV